MLSRSFIAFCLSVVLCNCSSSSDGAGSNRGPLVDNTQWVYSEAGEEFFGARPEGSVCELTPVNCAEYPWPQGKCVELVPNSPCEAAFIPECLDTFTVLAVYTRMQNPVDPLCNWITLEQPSLRAIHAGDQVEVRTRHSPLNAPVPGVARIGFVIGDEQVLDYTVTIPEDFRFPEDSPWIAPKDYPAGTPLLFHVDNHGSNEYMLIEVNVL